MKLQLFITVCSTTLLVLVSATSRDAQSTNEQDIGQLLANFASQFDASSLVNLTTPERFQSVLTALKVKLYQLNSSPAKENNELKSLINANSLTVDQCYEKAIANLYGETPYFLEASNSGAP